jgi:hypothetical protein
MRASAFCWTRSVPSAWGEPARPGFPPEGETGKGAFQFLAAAGYFLRAGESRYRLSARSIRSPQII